MIAGRAYRVCMVELVGTAPPLLLASNTPGQNGISIKTTLISRNRHAAASDKR